MSPVVASTSSLASSIQTPPLSSRRRLAGRPLSFRDVPPFGKGSLTRRSRPPRRRDPIVVRASGGSHQALSRATAVAIGHHPPPKHIFTPTTVIAGVFSAFPIVALFLRRKELLEKRNARAATNDAGATRGSDASSMTAPRPIAPPRGVGSIGSRLPGATHDTCVYLDYNATTPIFPEVAAAMEPFLWEHFGNPSSGHAFAAPCRDAIHKARGQVASMLGCDPTEVVFTSCGSESDNHAIASAVDLFVAKNRSSDSKPNATMNKPHVVSTAVEHPAILEYLAAKAKANELTYDLVPVNEEGLVDPKAVAAKVRSDTCLVTVMHANNETGAIQPVAECARLAREKNEDVLIHTDAAQSCGKIPVKVNDLGVDMCTVVGHKIGAPKGVAALYVASAAPFSKLLHGGGQESGRRAGTENVLEIVGLGAACELVEREKDILPSHMSAMRDELSRRLASGLGGDDGSGVRVNGPRDDAKRLPNTLSVGIKGVSASQLLDVLKDDVAASAGAACHSGEAAASVSAVLSAMAVPEEYAIGTLRLSVGRHTCPADVEKGAALVVDAARAQREEIAALPEGERPWWCVRKAVGLVD